MMRKARCKDCNNTFYAPVTDDRRTCQNCAGDAPDKTEQAAQEAAAKTAANTPPKSKTPQSVNPRTGRKGKVEGDA